MLTKQFNTTRKFYEELAERASQNQTTIDVYGLSLEQIGLAEFRQLVELTGGIIIF